jgi:translation elongation factor P/translation initiation factor 5A
MADKIGEKLQEERNEDIEAVNVNKETIHVEASSIDSKDFQNLDLDGAAKFLYDRQDYDTSEIDIKKLRHKIDRNVVSIMSLCFIMQFLDKAIYNVSIPSSSQSL